LNDVQIERKSDAMLKPDLSSQLQEEILLIGTTDSFSSALIFSNDNRNESQYVISAP